MRQAVGQPSNITTSILVRVTKASRGYFSRKGYALVDNETSKKGYTAHLVNRELISRETGVVNRS